MRLNRHAVGVFAASATLLVGGGSALAASTEGDRGGMCEQRLAKVAESRGVSVEQLQADIKARLLARIDAAEKAGKVSPERAARLQERVSAGSLCGARRHVSARIAAHSMLRAAAGFLDLDREQLRAQLPGTSLAALAQQQGKSASALEAAMVAPAKARLAKAVSDKKLSQDRASQILAKLEQSAERLATHVFAKK